MARIPADDVKLLFDENKGKNWRSFHNILMQHKGQTDSIEDSIIDALLLITPHMEQAGIPYPTSSDEMQRVLDSEISKATAKM